MLSRSCERRLRCLLVFVAATYAVSSLVYLCPDRPPSILLLANATWWRTTAPAYNLSLLQDVNDLNWLVDTSGFKFLINNKRCDNTDSVFIVVFVHSAPSNFHKRKVIRSTWGNESNLPGDEMKVVFLLGNVSDEKLQHEIHEENRIHQDIVQGNFVDSYRNLTYKHVMGLKWVTYYCRQARFVFKADDDIFVDIFQLSTFLRETFGETGDVANLMMCYLIQGPYVKRSQRSKWRVSFREYPGARYPEYCAGWTVLMSPDVVFRLYLLSSKVPYFWVDDVHVTGTLAGQVGISHVDFTEKLALAAVDTQKWLSSQEISKPYLFGQPNSNSETITAMWNRTVQYYGGSRQVR